MDNTKLIAEAREWKDIGQAFDEVRIMLSLADALEAAEAELTRRDTVIESIRELHHEKRVFGDKNRPYVICDYDKTPWPCRTDGLLAATPVSLEAVTPKPIETTNGAS